MHDPMVVAFEIRRPWPRRRAEKVRPGAKRWELTIYRKHGRDHQGPNPRQWWKPSAWSPFVTAFGYRWYFPSLVTIWHNEPGGHDSGEVCKHRRQEADGTWTYSNRWRWHVHHWSIQIPPLQRLRKALFDRCEVCGRRGNVSIAGSWNGRGVGWRKWRSAPDIYHNECYSLKMMRGQMETRANTIRTLVHLYASATGRSDDRILELATTTTGMPYHAGMDLAAVLGYERVDGRWVEKQQPAPRGAS